MKRAGIEEGQYELGLKWVGALIGRTSVVDALCGPGECSYKDGMLSEMFLRLQLQNVSSSQSITFFVKVGPKIQWFDIVLRVGLVFKT